MQKLTLKEIRTEELNLQALKLKLVTMEKNPIYFKDSDHQDDAWEFLHMAKMTSFSKNLEYGTLFYLLSALGKSELFGVFDMENMKIDVEKLREMISGYSTSERNMVRFALQCFNSSLDDIKISEVFASVSGENLLVIRSALELRYC